MSSSKSHSDWCLKCSLVICSVCVFFSSCVTLTWRKQKKTRQVKDLSFIHPSALHVSYVYFNREMSNKISSKTLVIVIELKYRPFLLVKEFSELWMPLPAWKSYTLIINNYFLPQWPYHSALVRLMLHEINKSHNVAPQLHCKKNIFSWETQTSFERPRWCLYMSCFIQQRVQIQIH